MSKNKPSQLARKNEMSIVRSSAAEYLTFVAASGSSESSVEMRYEDENIWLTQKMMAIGGPKGRSGSEPSWTQSSFARTPESLPALLAWT